MCPMHNRQLLQNIDIIWFLCNMLSSKYVLSSVTKDVRDVCERLVRGTDGFENIQYFSGWTERAFLSFTTLNL